MSNTVKLNTCPKCKAPIPAEAPQGLCPRCVLLGAATATEAGVPATATSEIPSLERIARAFPQLEVLELIGRGGMGFVFKARQPHLDRFVALKLLPDKLAKDALFAERFNREGRVLAKLNHPNIVSVFDFGQTGGFYYLTMEYVDGVNLRQAMRAGRFSPAEALALVPKVCEALQYAHEQGILHRDIKPENILLDTKGRVKIADFGIAKLVGEDQPNITLTNTGAALGTPHYMAPEQLEKPTTVDHRADIYSLGVVFYEMLTGELPIGRFAAPSSKTPVNSSVDDVVFRTLEKDREMRFQSAGEMKTSVEGLAVADAAAMLPEIAPTEDFILCNPRLPRMARLVTAYVVVGAPALFMISAFAWLQSIEGQTPHFETLVFDATIKALEAITLIFLVVGGFKLRGLRPPGPKILRGTIWSRIALLAVGIPVGFAIAAGSDGEGLHPIGTFEIFEVTVACVAMGFEIASLVWLRRSRAALDAICQQAEAGVGPHGTRVLATIPSVANPARALLAAGVLTWAGSTAAIVWMSFGGAGQQCLNTRPELVLVITPLFALSSVIIAGALKMRKLEAHPLAIAASVLAMLTSLGSIVGLPAGIWAFRTLRRPNVRAAFARQRQALRPAPAPGPLPVSRAAFLGAASTILSLPFPVVAIAMMLSHKGGMGVTGLWITIITACGFGVAGTILGCLGVSSIMESRGRLRGLGMGWFAAAMWPLLVVVGIPLSIPWFSLAERSGRSEVQPAAVNGKAIETAPMIQFTFTSVELREEQGARWLAMDYVEQVRGDCQHTFRYDARVPGFTMQTRMDSALSDAKAGFEPVLSQRVLWKLPDSLPQSDALALRDLVAKQWVGKSAAIEPGDERVLFKTLVPDGGTLATAVGVRLKSDGNASGATQRQAAPPPKDAASAELWAPKLALGERPNVSEILQEAKRLTDAGRYEEALQHHIWYHNHALEIQPSQMGVRLSFALSYWAELAQRYPKAKEALNEIRDRGTQAFARGEGRFDLFREVSSINEQLGRQKETLALFESIHSQDPKLGRQCYGVVEDLLVEKGDYALCESFISDFHNRFSALNAEWRGALLRSERSPEANRDSLRQHAQRTFIKDTRKLVEILVGVSRNTEAEALRDQAVALLDVPELRSAVTDTEHRVAKTVAAVPVFGRVLECVLPDSTAIDLFSGFVKTVPASLANQKDMPGMDLAICDWIQRQDLDIAYLGRGEFYNSVQDMKTLTGEEWNDFNPAQLAASLHPIGKDVSGKFGDKVPFSYTYGFKTRAGRLGLLQIIGYSDKQTGVKIRYKLAEAMPAKQP